MRDAGRGGDNPARPVFVGLVVLLHRIDGQGYAGLGFDPRAAQRFHLVTDRRLFAFPLLGRLHLHLREHRRDAQIVALALQRIGLAHRR
ncbi:hypothetical protein [Croceicoccus hydrothermalis]|uniref:hypothetical protein n=1 Tax=Croceicoccus hydrothermalis TaxID=2867964 RepID=UPI001EFC15EC|nr:hypothetical protein [Croceicoccus hydrothermalis]